MDDVGANDARGFRDATVRTLDLLGIPLDQFWRLLKAVGRRHAVPPFQVLYSSSRYRAVTAARHELWIATLGTFALSYSATADLFGVDHSTVMAAEQKRFLMLGLCHPKLRDWERRKSASFRSLELAMAPEGELDHATGE